MKESSDDQTLMAVGTWFQIWGAAEEKASVLIFLLFRFFNFPCSTV